MKDKYIIILCIIVFIFGITLGFFLKSFSNEIVITLFTYACHDGCSIATKDNEGYLTNKTWDCWEECNEYLIDVWELKKGDEK